MSERDPIHAIADEHSRLAREFRELPDTVLAASSHTRFRL